MNAIVPDDAMHHLILFAVVVRVIIILVPAGAVVVNQLLCKNLSIIIVGL